MHRLFYSILFLLAMAGCVSVNLGDGKTEKAKGVRFQSPGGNFSSVSEDHVDAVWRNQKTGNAISFLSECGPHDPSLESVTRGILSGFSKHDVLEQKTTDFNNREALITTFKAPVDGVPSQSELVVFKKNGCVYILTYVALEKTFKDDHGAFQKFLREFKAP